MYTIEEAKSVLEEGGIVEIRIEETSNGKVLIADYKEDRTIYTYPITSEGLVEEEPLNNGEYY
jgi:hypothetical protein